MSNETPDSTSPQIPAPQPGVDPYELLASVDGAPTKAQVEVWKSATCNNRLKIFSLDTKFNRLFILRGLSAQEWLATQKSLPANITEDRAEMAMRVAVVAKACSWCSVTKGRISEDFMNTGGAGMTDSLYEVVCSLSDFVPPVMIERLSADL